MAHTPGSRLQLQPRKILPKIRPYEATVGPAISHVTRGLAGFPPWPAPPPSPSQCPPRRRASKRWRSPSCRRAGDGSGRAGSAGPGRDRRPDGRAGAGCPGRRLESLAVGRRGGRGGGPPGGGAAPARPGQMPPVVTARWWANWGDALSGVCNWLRRAAAHSCHRRHPLDGTLHVAASTCGVAPLPCWQRGHSAPHRRLPRWPRWQENVCVTEPAFSLLTNTEKSNPA